MGKAKKTEDHSKKSDNNVEARPIGQGKDPLAEGATLHNPSNSEAATHYEADTSELKAEERAAKERGLDANERAEVHNAQSPQPQSDAPNADLDEQEEVAEGRVEPGTEGGDEEDPLTEKANRKAA